MENSNSNRYLSFVQQFPYDQPGWEGSVTICFGQAHVGWILFWLSTTAYLQSITIFTSHVFDPYPALISWLEEIILDQIPADVEIDEEGSVKTLRVARAENNLLDFQILDSYSHDANAEILFRVRVPKSQLVSEFVRKFDLFLEEYYQPDQWEFGFDLRNLDLTKIRNYLR